MNKLDSLRALMREQEIDAYLVPHADEYQGEDTDAYAERLCWLTGFTGSAGFAVITLDKAAFFTDGRYTLQASAEVDPSSYAIVNSADISPAKWLKDQNITVVGLDPWLFTETQLKAYQDFSLKFLDSNLIDTLWCDQPERSLFFGAPHPLSFSGESSEDKIKKLLETTNADKILFTLSDSIAWLLNIRGRDVEYTPLFHSYLLLDKSGSYDLFVNLDKITAELYNHIKDSGRAISIDYIDHHLKEVPSESVVQVEAETCPMALQKLLEHTQIQQKCDPAQLPKSIKNATEIDGMKKAHVRDGVALCEFLHWLSEQPLAGETTELSARDKLFTFRQKQENFKRLSFDTIAGFGPHGAIIHYRVDAKSSLPLTKNSLFLLDSGAQYLDGTTDVTRTLALGKPTPEQKENYTLVLKGHSALARAIFPQGTSGSQLDILARSPLWQKGRDYEHGTGHGVGSYLCVHEGPQNIGKRANSTSLQPGMILSNEPGYYKEGAYGIRIESLILVVKKESGFYGFETITMAPFDHTLIDLNLLTQEEIAWINTYHQKVYEALSPEMNEDAKMWLKKATTPLH